MDELKQSLQTLSIDLQEIKTSLQLLTENQSKDLQKEWFDGQDVMLALKISSRTLQTMRNNGLLPYSQVRGKFYYKVSDLEGLLKSNYSKIK